MDMDTSQLGVRIFLKDFSYPVTPRDRTNTTACAQQSEILYQNIFVIVCAKKKVSTHFVIQLDCWIITQPQKTVLHNICTASWITCPYNCLKWKLSTFLMYASRIICACLPNLSVRLASVNNHQQEKKVTWIVIWGENYFRYALFQDNNILLGLAGLCISTLGMGMTA